MKRDFEIAVPHFYCLEYYRDGKKMILDIDFRDPVTVLSPDMIDGWEQPHEKEFIDEDEKKRIITDIYRYFTEIEGDLKGFRMEGVDEND